MKKILGIQHLAYCDRCCDVDSSDNFLFFEEKIVVLYW